MFAAQPFTTLKVSKRAIITNENKSPAVRINELFGETCKSYSNIFKQATTTKHAKL